MEINDIKKLINQITTYVSIETNRTYQVYPLTIKEFYQNEENYPFSHNIKRKYTHNYNGFNDKKGISTILIDENDLTKPIPEIMMKYAQITFHELRHTMQLYKDEDSYETFFIKLDKIIQYHNYTEYKLEYNNFSYEIDANLYGIIKAEKYLQAHYPTIYEAYQTTNYKNKINKKKADTIHKLLTYDHISRVDKVMNALQNGYISYPQIQYNLPRPMHIFLDENGNYKPLNTIIDNPALSKLDTRITYTILSSRLFLETVDFENLTIPERKILLKSLRYAWLRIQKEQEETKKYYQQYGTPSTQINNEPNPITRLELNIEQLASTINKHLNPVTDYHKNKKHKKKIPTILNQLEGGTTSD